MTTATQQEKARRIVAEGRVQILARSKDGALGIIVTEQGRTYTVTVLNHATPSGTEPYAGTCTCVHFARTVGEDLFPAYSLKHGEGCKHYRALLMALEA